MEMKIKLFSLTKKDFEIQTFHSGGPGGQNQNKRDTGVRIIHSASGAVGEARDSRSQLENKRTALKRLTETGKFRIWVARRSHEIELGKTVEQQVDEIMQPENLKIEYADEDGNWKVVD